MMRLRSRYAVLFILCIIGLGVLFYTQTTTNAATSWQKPPHTVVMPTFSSTPSYITGVRGIAVHTTKSGASPNVADFAFSEQNVRDYVMAHPPFDGPLVQGAQAKIVSMQFISAKRASVVLGGELLTRPDDYPICYVKVHGPFIFEGHSPPPPPRLKKAGPRIVQYGEIVFDGHTGNVLLWGSTNK